MSAVTRPRGPLPARVYWTRRAVVLGVAFLLVFTLARVLGGGSDGRSNEPDQAAPAAGDPTSHAPTATTGPETTGDDRSKGDRKQPRKVLLAEPDGPCAPEDVRIRANIEQVASSADIKIPLKLTTRVPACTFEVSRESVVVKITSGRDNIWSSQDCRGLETRTVVVRAERPAWAKLVWNGRRSGIACGPSAAWALPGWYHVAAAPLGGEPIDVMFELTPRKPERITQSAEPKGDDRRDKKKADESDEKDEKRGDRRG